MKKIITDMKMKRIMGLLLITVLLSSCGTYKSVHIGDIGDVSFKGMVDNRISLELQVPISNPNGYKIKIKSMDLDVSINGNYLGKMKNSEVLIIPKKSDQIHNLSVDIIMKNPLAGVATFYRLRKASRFDMEIKGTIRVKALLKGKNIEVSEKQSISL